jgi:coenzyme F420-reducing hydrogenase beta subunit
MAADDEGFPYPQVDESACIECRKCVLVCPGFHDISRQGYKTEPQFFGGYVEDDPVRRDSSSGGFFTVLAERTLSDGGVVYGASIDFVRMTVAHNRSAGREGLASMRKSKYVQSNMHGIHAQVRKDLESGRAVLFSGTPCQVAGLTQFLGGHPANLLTLDLICHGVPSPALFTSHFSLRQQKLGTAITNIDFRTKDKGWGGSLNFYLKVSTDQGAVLTFAPLDAFYALFLANLSLRPVCYRCKFAATLRVGDITLGDFWGVQKEHPELYDGKGTSLVLANTDKGEKALNEIQNRLNLKVLDEVRPLPPNLIKPTPEPALRDTLLSSINFHHWGKQRFWKHLLALGVLLWNKAQQAARAALRRK